VRTRERERDRPDPTSPDPYIRFPSPSHPCDCDFDVASYLDIFVLQCFDVETNGGNGLHGFVAFVLQPIKNGCFSGIVESKNEDSHLFGSEEAFEDLAHENSHVARCGAVSSGDLHVNEERWLACRVTRSDP